MKSENFSEFSERTERLARLLSKNLNDLPCLIGISPAMFYAYRTGKNLISSKAWRKLESAERDAGIQMPLHPVSRSVISEEAADRMLEAMPPLNESDAEFMRQNLPRMIQIMGRMQQSLSPLPPGTPPA